MSEHTKEPWILGKYNKHCVMGSDNKLVVSDYYEDRETSEANAKRIVACVNACAKISNEALQEPMFRDAMKLKGSYIDLMAKNAKLEAELKEAKELLNTPDTIEKCLAVEEFLKG